jgi:uncharacterized protein (DUF427 family)
MKAIWNDIIITESEETIHIEGNHYFPPDSIKKEYFHKSNNTSRCIWKGKANYLSVTVNGKTNQDCVWFFPKPSFLAKKITGHIAFWNGVKVHN